jgi:hypothetical protein
METILSFKALIHAPEHFFLTMFRDLEVLQSIPGLGNLSQKCFQGPGQSFKAWDAMLGFRNTPRSWKSVQKNLPNQNWLAHEFWKIFQDQLTLVGP